MITAKQIKWIKESCNPGSLNYELLELARCLANALVKGFNAYQYHLLMDSDAVRELLRTEESKKGFEPAPIIERTQIETLLERLAIAQEKSNEICQQAVDENKRAHQEAAEIILERTKPATPPLPETRSEQWGRLYAENRELKEENQNLKEAIAHLNGIIAGIKEAVDEQE